MNRGAGKFVQLESFSSPIYRRKAYLQPRHDSRQRRGARTPLLPRYSTATAPASGNSRARVNEPAQGGFNYIAVLKQEFQEEQRFAPPQLYRQPVAYLARLNQEGPATEIKTHALTPSVGSVVKLATNPLSASACRISLTWIAVIISGEKKHRANGRRGSGFRGQSSQRRNSHRCGREGP